MNLADKTNLRLLRAAIETALESVAEHHGLKLKTAGIRFEGDGAACKITLDVQNRDAKPKEERDFEKYLHFFEHEGLKAEHLHQSFTFNGNTVELIGLRPNAGRFPLIVRNNTTGKRICVGLSLVGKKGTNGQPTTL